ncbi:MULTISPECIES: DUF1217 domain-containing protein [Methylosinus]|uniref:DUF1217 domain-containing protein n=1 Tax=Methylosinus trichosporium (strain ATCC 35070 / NCIMB 11131 / UNIQEM 75 / OB3b) TaxID=595536 RepID=A0A2D2D165_METT3|nr:MULTISPECIES: DUF1217 domain-containing protein [Methylosinus]ATQ68704.1 DUF1217 domain-containing protein [Methylosinus trichosporium OB3b]OBS53136.1 hypothetical protein A8B73_07490 [Methylosinus sp. 3S-1]
MTTLSTYLQIANNQSLWQSMTAKQPDVATQTQYFEDNIGKVQSVDDFMKNDRLFNYAMTAFGLGDMTYAKGMMQKVLEQGVSDNSALANTLNNANIKAFATAFDFADNGASTTSSSTLVDNVVSRYAEQSLEDNQGQQNPGVQLALYFQRNAPSITSVYGILADSKILSVVQTALGISTQTTSQSIDSQAAMLTSKLDITDFQDPKKLQQFISRFAAMYDYNNSGSDANSQSSLLSTLFDSSSSDSSFGLDSSLLLSVQGVRFNSF